jgi:hypothetical protein
MRVVNREGPTPRALSVSSEDGVSSSSLQFVFLHLGREGLEGEGGTYKVQGTVYDLCEDIISESGWRQYYRGELDRWSWLRAGMRHVELDG